MTDQTDDLCEPDNPAAYALARHIADHPVSTIQAAFRYLNAPLAIELHEEASAGVTPAADETERRDRYAEALWPLTDWDGDRLNAERAADAVMAIADAEQAELRRERDLAIAHDRQPYPTAWAYEQACKALHRKTETIEWVVAFLDRDQDGLCCSHATGQIRALLDLAPAAAPAVDRAAILRAAADIAESLRQFEPATGARKSAQVSENVGILRVAAELRRRAACPWCESGTEHDVHCPTPETHNWGCGCPSDVAAAIASCPGREMSPSPCRCPCYGCKHHCGAHNPAELRRLADETPDTEAHAVPVQHAPGKAIRCPDCRAKGYAVCLDESVVTVHAIPVLGTNGISACCGRPPCEFVGERLTRDPDKVTCPGPVAGQGQDGTATETPAPGSTESRPCRTFVSGGTVWCCEEGETDCPCVCHQPAAGARQDGAQS